ncbi:MAG: HutD/Ves family protein [Janthinobacterium lividum]
MGSVLRAAGLPVSLWPNGAGRKADLLTGDGWMVSFAWLDADAPFSLMPDIDRTITLIDGPGFTLDVAGQALPVPTLFVPTLFDGGATTTCAITGPSRVLNVMTKRGAFRHSVTILDRSDSIVPEGGPACLAVLLDGRGAIGGVDLGRLDAVCLDGVAELTLSAGGTVAVVTIELV